MDREAAVKLMRALVDAGFIVDDQRADAAVDNNPPSNWAMTFLAPTGNKPGNGSIGLVTACVAFLKSR